MLLLYPDLHFPKTRIRNDPSDPVLTGKRRGRFPATPLLKTENTIMQKAQLLKNRRKSQPSLVISVAF